MDKLRITSRSIKRLRREIAKIRNIFIKEDLREHAKILHSLDELSEGLDHLESNLVAVLENSVKRHSLIDEQIAKEVFENDLHDKYHIANTELVISIKNLYLSIKTFLNKLPHVYKSFYDNPKDLRDIKVGSFGKWLNSMELVEKSNTKLYLNNLTRGREIDETIVRARDDIEHGTPSGDGKILASAPLSSRVEGATMGSYKPIKPSTHDTSRKIVGGKAHWTKFVNGSNPSIYWYYVHFSPYKDNFDNKVTHVKEGEGLGMVYHSIPSHFKNYGIHHHIFTTPNLSSSEIASKSHPDAIFNKIPEPAHAVATVCNYILDTLKQVKQNSRI